MDAKIDDAHTLILLAVVTFLDRGCIIFCIYLNCIFYYIIFLFFNIINSVNISFFFVEVLHQNV